MRTRLLSGVLLALLFVACGQVGGGSTDLSAVTLAATKTQDAETARFAMDMTLQFEDQTVDATGSGELDFPGELSHITMTMSGVAGEQGLETEMYTSGLRLYMRTDSFGAALPGVKDWVEIDLEAVGSEMGFNLGPFRQLSQTDPTSSLNYLLGASSVERIGTEEIRGEPTTHYVVVAEWDAMIDELPEESRDAAAESIEAIKEWTGQDEITFDVWIDSAGRMRRQRMRFEYVKGPIPGATMDMTMELFDFGADVDIQLPDPSTVTTFQELMEQFQPQS